ncbi:MAG TPA: thiol:disulfide interchange protein DsbA/DsbL [Xanthomonadaceae bacterium]|nr:thiol:disulfide interchange protein DsbA/DsbL [Xanthomonadaceae bacterium]
MIQRALFILAGLLLAGACSAQSGSRFVEGQHYFAITPAQPTASGNRVEVVELFSYLCVHCATLAPRLGAWKENMPEQAHFSHMPAIFNNDLATLARAFYAAEVLGILDQSHQALFRAIHVERKPLRSLEDLARFHSQFGVTEEQFLDAAKSFAVETKINRARQMGMRYQIDGTPTLVIAGKYRATITSAGGYDELFELIEELVAREAANRVAG